MVLVVEEEEIGKEIDDRGFEYVSFEEEDQLSAQGELTGLLQPRSK